MDENNQQKPSIDEIIAEVEGEEDLSTSKSFFKKPIGIAVIILVVVILIILITSLTDRITDNDIPQPLSSEDKLEILKQLSQDASVSQVSVNEKLNILEELSQSQKNGMSSEEKLKLLNSMSN